MPEHVANEEEMLSALSAREREQLARLMHKLLAGLEGGRREAGLDSPARPSPRQPAER